MTQAPRLKAWESSSELSEAESDSLSFAGGAEEAAGLCHVVGPAGIKVLEAERCCVTQGQGLSCSSLPCFLFSQGRDPRGISQPCGSCLSSSPSSSRCSRQQQEGASSEGRPSPRGCCGMVASVSHPNARNIAPFPSAWAFRAGDRCGLSFPRGSPQDCERRGGFCSHRSCPPGIGRIGLCSKEDFCCRSAPEAPVTLDSQTMAPQALLCPQ
ncbi:Gallinacin-5 [Aix galericulata]|nr:Gallinacin-5 [Aix galericulata]